MWVVSSMWIDNIAVGLLVDEAQRLSPEVLIRFDFLGDDEEGAWGCSLLPASLGPNEYTFPDGSHEIYGKALSPRDALEKAMVQLRVAALAVKKMVPSQGKIQLP